MSLKAKAEARELINCADGLQTLSAQLEDYIKKTEAGLNALGGIWQDAKYNEFKQNFYPRLKNTEPLVKEMQDWGVKLKNRAEAIEQYHNV